MPKFPRPGNKSFSNIAIRTQVRVLAAIGVALMAGTHIVNDRLRSRAMMRHAAFIAVKEHVIRLDISVLMMRRWEKDFFLRRDMEYVDRYLADHAAAQAALKTLSGMKKAGKHAAQVDQIGEDLEAHKAQFLHIVAHVREIGLDENKCLRGSLRGVAHAIEAKLGNFDHEGLQVKMLMMRRHEKDFMLRGDKKHIARVAIGRQEFENLLAASEIAAVDQQEIRKLLAAYHRGVLAYADVKMELAAEKKKLGALHEDLAPRPVILSNAASAGQEESATAMASMGGTIRILLIVATLAIFSLVGRGGRLCHRA